MRHNSQRPWGSFVSLPHGSPIWLNCRRPAQSPALLCCVVVQLSLFKIKREPRASLVILLNLWGQKLLLSASSLFKYYCLCGGTDKSGSARGACVKEKEKRMDAAVSNKWVRKSPCVGPRGLKLLAHRHCRFFPRVHANEDRPMRIYTPRTNADCWFPKIDSLLWSHWKPQSQWRATKSKATKYFKSYRFQNLRVVAKTLSQLIKYLLILYDKVEKLYF